MFYLLLHEFFDNKKKKMIPVRYIRRKQTCMFFSQRLKIKGKGVTVYTHGEVRCEKKQPAFYLSLIDRAMSRPNKARSFSHGHERCRVSVELALQIIGHDYGFAFQPLITCPRGIFNGLRELSLTAEHLNRSFAASCSR